MFFLCLADQARLVSRPVRRLTDKSEGSRKDYLSTTDTVTLTSDTPAILTTVPETWTVNSSCPWKSAFAVYEKDGPWMSTLPDCGGAISFTSFMFVDPSFKPRVHVVPLAICMVHSTASEGAETAARRKKGTNPRMQAPRKATSLQKRGCRATLYVQPCASTPSEEAFRARLVPRLPGDAVSNARALGCEFTRVESCGV